MQRTTINSRNNTCADASACACVSCANSSNGYLLKGVAMAMLVFACAIGILFLFRNGVTPGVILYMLMLMIFIQPILKAHKPGID